MIITAKNKSYRCDKDGWHFHRRDSRYHRITGPAHIGENYCRDWRHLRHEGFFQETGPSFVDLDGISYGHRINRKRCSKGEYEDYCENQKL